MKRLLVSTFILLAYSTLLIKIMVLKDVPLIRVGILMLNFGGTQEGQANIVPFKTIVPYLLGANGLIIGGLNLIGNIILLVPFGFLVPLVYRNITWEKSLVIAGAAGFAIDGMQVLFRVGIFDIDDVILNAFGVMIGYWTFAILATWLRSKNYKNIIIASVIVIGIIAAAFYAIAADLKSQPVRPDVKTRSGQSNRLDTEEGKVSESGDLCGGAGGTEKIVSKGKNTITIKGSNRAPQTIGITDQTTIKTSAGLRLNPL